MEQIVVQNLSLGYDGLPVVQNLSFAVHTGDFLCVVGENGSGKSTLIKALLGIHPKLSGTISFSSDLSPKKIGYLPQQTPAQKDFPASVYEVVLSGCVGQMGARSFYTRTEKDLAKSAMKRLEIEDLSSRCYRDLSGGQQQRVLLARALCATGELLILDEPVSGLDPHVTSELYEIVTALNREHNITIIMISHDASALRFASHVLHLRAQNHFFGTVEAYRNSSEGNWFFHGNKEEVL